ncbi:hypothetical protein C0991_002498 [Blastosporella zonata]|nr:hypothetical protein C0991_002498 [Blastosporella zonata]
MSKLPSTTKLLHAEVVLRKDLRARFLNMRKRIQQTATRHISDRRKKDAAWDEFGKEEIVFHGTPRHNVGSIVRSGFVVPGERTVQGEEVEVRCGSTWGKIVCAVIMGRRRVLGAKHRRVAAIEEDFDSHVSPSKYEYIVFNSAQILPLYVLHLGESKHRSNPDNLALRPSSMPFEGNLTAYARKHLPDGFGAASGHRFLVLEIAPIDDDEELWGDYQHVDSHDEGEFQGERWSYWVDYYKQ